MNSDELKPKKMPSITESIKKLSHESHSTVYNALLQLRTVCMKPAGIKDFGEKGGIKPLLLLLEKPRLSDISLSILANCCLEDDIRNQVMLSNGISTIVRVFRCLASESIQNRACRALANLALSPKAVHSLHKQGISMLIVKFLSETKHPSSQQTAIRAIRLLSCGFLYRDKIVETEGAFHISNLVKSENAAVVSGAIKTLACLTEHCTIECAQQIHRSQCLSKLIELSSQSDESNKENSLLTLVNLSTQSVIRPELGNAGLVQLLIKATESRETCNVPFLSLVTALCLCCREAVNRVRIRDNDGLKTLLSLLRNEMTMAIRERVICSLLAFRFDEASLEVLLELGLVEILVEQLLNFILDNEREHQLQDDVPIASNSTATDLDENPKEVECVIEKNDIEVNLDKKKVFCIHSPSYQQVQNEHIDGQKSAIQDSYSYTNYRDIPSPSSTISYCLSPDRSPQDWSLPSPPNFSPIASPNWSPIYDSRCSSQSSDSSGNDEPEEPYLSSRCYSPVCHDNASDSECSKNNAVLEVKADNEVAREELVQLNEPVLVEARKFKRKTKRRTTSEQLSRSVSPGSDSSSSRRDSTSSRSDSFSSRTHYTKKVKRSPIIHKEEETIGGQIIQLISHISQMEKHSVCLATKPCLSVLMDYLSRLSEPSLRAERIFIRLLKNYNCFDALISFNIITLVNKHLPIKHDLESCRNCRRLQNTRKKAMNNLSLLSESGYGIGVLSHILLTGQQFEIATCILTIPHLVKGHYQLRKLLCDCNGLNQLLQLLDGEFSVEAVESFSVLCKNFFSAPKVSSGCNTKGETVNDICLYSDFSADVQFLLDDGTTLLANRKILATKSPFFNAMLEGSFVESSLEQVTLPAITNQSLTIILHHLYGCTTNCALFKNLSNDVTLELISICDRLLLTDLAVIIESEIISNLKPDFVQSVYGYAVRFEWDTLSQAVLKYVLTGEMSPAKRHQCFQDLRFTSTVGEVFIGDVQKTITNKILENNL